MIMVVAVAAISTSCTVEFEADKNSFAKQINTIGDSEMIRDIKFEKFEPSVQITVAQIMEAAKDNYEAEKQRYITKQISSIQSNISSEYRSITSNKSQYDYYKKEYARTKYSYYKGVIKEYKDKIAKSEKAIEEYKSKKANFKIGSVETTSMQVYNEIYVRANDFIIHDDVVAYQYDVTYVVDAIAGKVRNHTKYTVTPYDNFVDDTEVSADVMVQYFYTQFKK